MAVTELERQTMDPSVESQSSQTDTEPGSITGFRQTVHHDIDVKFGRTVGISEVGPDIKYEFSPVFLGPLKEVVADWRDKWEDGYVTYLKINGRDAVKIEFPKPEYLQEKPPNLFPRYVTSRAEPVVVVSLYSGYDLDAAKKNADSFIKSFGRFTAAERKKLMEEIKQVPSSRYANSNKLQILEGNLLQGAHFEGVSRNGFAGRLRPFIRVA